MSDAVSVVVKALNGGAFVVLFALVGEAAVPKRFAGLFSAAPSVALANLIVVVAMKGGGGGGGEGGGGVVGAPALFVACAVGIFAVRRIGALRGSLALCAVWLVVGEAASLLVLR